MGTRHRYYDTQKLMGNGDATVSPTLWTTQKTQKKQKNADSQTAIKIQEEGEKDHLAVEFDKICKVLVFQLIPLVSLLVFEEPKILLVIFAKAYLF